MISEVFPGSDHLGSLPGGGVSPSEVPSIGRASRLTPHLVPGSATSTSSLSRLRASWVLPLHSSEVERSLRGNPRGEQWSDLLGQLRVGWWNHGCTPSLHHLPWVERQQQNHLKKKSLAWTLILPVFHWASHSTSLSPNPFICI